MQKLHEIREARAAKVAEARALLDNAQGKLNADQQKTFDGLKSEITDLEGQEQRAQFIAEAEKRSMAGAADKPFQSLQGEISILEVLRNAMEGRSQSGAAAEYGKEIERRTGRKPQGLFVPLSALETRVAAPIDTTTAAELVATNNRADLYVQPLRD